MADDEDGVYVFFDDSEGENYGDIDLDDYDMLTEVTDTSSAQARKGKDVHGILWDKLNLDREKYRTTRLESYNNFRNVPISEEEINKKCKQTEKGGNYYDFFHNTRLVKPTIVHFQHTSISPDRRLVTVVDGLLLDSQTRRAGPDCFASAWHPNERTFATGSQDKTCRVWDTRKQSSPVTVLEGSIGAIR